MPGLGSGLTKKDGPSPIQTSAAVTELEVLKKKMDKLTRGIDEENHLPKWIVNTLVMMIDHLWYYGVKGKCVSTPATRKWFKEKGFKVRQKEHRASVYIGWTPCNNKDLVKATLHKHSKCLVGVPCEIVPEFLKENQGLQCLYTQKCMTHKDGQTNIAWIAKGLELKRNVMWSDDEAAITSRVPEMHRAYMVKGCDEPTEQMEGVKQTIKVAAWNIVSLRSIWNNGWLEKFVCKEKPDILCLYEVKASQRQMNKMKGWKEWIKAQGYQWIQWTHSVEKLGYAGTCILSRVEPITRTRGLGVPSVDKEGRVLTMEFEEFVIVSCYAPCVGMNGQGNERRLAYDEAIVGHLKNIQKPVMWLGDLNVAIRDIDVFDGPTNSKRQLWPGFTVEERARFTDICEKTGLNDAYLHFNADSGPGEHYTFFQCESYRKAKKRVAFGLHDGL